MVVKCRNSTNSKKQKTKTSRKIKAVSSEVGEDKIETKVKSKQTKKIELTTIKESEESEERKSY